VFSALGIEMLSVVQLKLGMKDLPEKTEKELMPLFLLQHPCLIVIGNKQ
jgi:hypothetical protein